MASPLAEEQMSFKKESCPVWTVLNWQLFKRFRKTLARVRHQSVGTYKPAHTASIQAHRSLNLLLHRPASALHPGDSHTSHIINCEECESFLGVDSKDSKDTVFFWIEKNLVTDTHWYTNFLCHYTPPLHNFLCPYTRYTTFLPIHTEERSATEYIHSFLDRKHILSVRNWCSDNCAENSCKLPNIVWL